MNTKSLTQEELSEVLRKHRLWLDNKEGGVRANLAGEDLTNVNLEGACLKKAYLMQADFESSWLIGANLEGAFLEGACLKNTYLREAHLEGAELVDANLENAVLIGAHLEWANLESANLAGADFEDANLERANLRWTIVTGTQFRRANLKGTDIDFSCLPLWCGSLKANFDDGQLRQIAYHLVKAGLNSDNASKETKAELSKLIDFANKFHRVDECGRIKMPLS